MGRPKQKHDKKDRGTNKREVANLRTFVKEGKTFLSDTSKAGGFTSAAKGLVKVQAITRGTLALLDECDQFDVPEGTFEKLSKGAKVSGIGQPLRRAIIQKGVDEAVAIGAKTYGLRNL